MASSSYKKFSPVTNSSDKAALAALATQYGGTANYARGVVEYKVKGNGTSATRSIGLGETPNLAPHARETDNAMDPANNKAQDAVRTGTAIPDIGTYTPITSSTLTPTPAVPNIPAPPAPSNTGTQAMNAIGGLASGGAGTTPTPPAGPTPAESLQKLIDSTKQAPNAEKIYQKTENEVKLAEKQAAVNNFQNQLNAITAKANADKLGLVGQGRGVPEAIIGGIQAQIDREAAIQALPISVLLASSQADLATAQDHLDTLFKIRLQDAQAKVDYSNKIAGIVYQYATDQQKIALDAKTKADDRAFTLTQNSLNYAQSLATAALQSGQSSLAAQIMRLDPNSPTYSKDVANYASGIRIPQTSTGTSGGTLNGKPLTQAQVIAKGYADRAAEADKIIDGFGASFTGIASYLGQSLPNFAKSSERQQYEQAQRNFVNAILRPESGAVISEEEFNNARRQYFPQPGDQAQVVAQKADNRQTKINALYAAGNTAQPATPGSIIEDADGKRYVVGADGETLTEI